MNRKPKNKKASRSVIERANILQLITEGSVDYIETAERDSNGKLTENGANTIAKELNRYALIAYLIESAP